LADLIIVGNVESVKQTGTGSIELDGRIYERLDFRAEVHVDETIKGEPAPLHFVFTYSAPGMDYAGNVAAGDLAGGGLLVGSYEIIFLKKTATGYAFVSPFFPSFPATSKSCGPNWQIDLGEDAYHRVLQRELSVLCAASSRDEKQRVLSTLSWEEDSSSAPFLRAALDLPAIKSDPVLRTSVLSDLLESKDLTVLPLAEDDLFLPSQRTEGYLKANLLKAISGLDPSISVPMLSRALDLPEVDARIGAARFLEYTQSDAALDALLGALNDPDSQVQFAVMQSLGNLTGEHEWRPTTDGDLDPSWSACLRHWAEFANQRRVVSARH
jgi:hypothetical protein